MKNQIFTFFRSDSLGHYSENNPRLIIWNLFGSNSGKPEFIFVAFLKPHHLYPHTDDSYSQKSI